MLLCIKLNISCIFSLEIASGPLVFAPVASGPLVPDGAPVASVLLASTGYICSIFNLYIFSVSVICDSHLLPSSFLSFSNIASYCFNFFIADSLVFGTNSGAISPLNISPQSPNVGDGAFIVFLNKIP